MSILPRWNVDPADEQRHQPDGEPLWNESYYMDFVADDESIGGYVRLGLYPNLGVSWWTTAIVQTGGPTLMSVAYDLGVTPIPALSAKGPSLDVELEVARSLEDLIVRCSARAERFDDPADVYRGISGTEDEIGMELQWLTDGVPYHYDVATRYEIPCRVGGSIRLGGKEISITGQGQRDHSWGVRDWWAFDWCWFAARLDDGRRVHGADIRIPEMRMAFGYVQSQATGVAAIGRLDVTEELGVEDMPSVGHAGIDPGDLELTIEPLAFAPLLLSSADGRMSRFPRAMARFTDASGCRGVGWVEWNQVQPA